MVPSKLRHVSVRGAGAETYHGVRYLERPFLNLPDGSGHGLLKEVRHDIVPCGVCIPGLVTQQAQGGDARCFTCCSRCFAFHG